MKQKLGLVFLHYIRILAKLQLAKLNLFRKVLGEEKIKIVGITGSAGKTSTMLATMAALQDNFRVKYTEKANSESGIPLNILGLKMNNFSFQDWLRVAILSIVNLVSNWRNYDVYVVEMGVDEPETPKNMSYLLRIIRPDIGVFVSVSLVHALQFEQGLDAPKAKQLIADEKAKLISALPRDGSAVLNFEDSLVRERKKLTLANVIGIGKNEKAEIKLTGYETSLNGTTFNYQIGNIYLNLKFDKLVLPRVYGINFGLALGVAKALGVDLKDAAKGIEKHFKLPPGRSSLIKGIKNTYIIDSSYNASPAAMNTMLDLLDRFGEKLNRKKIAVLGDMRELGGQSETEHEQIAEKAVRVADQIIVVGPEMKKHFIPKASTYGDDRHRKSTAYNTAGEAAEYLKESLAGRELILVKGSQNTIFLEIVVEALMADPSQADQLLCRRGKYWEKKRRLFRPICDQ